MKARFAVMGLGFLLASLGLPGAADQAQQAPRDKVYSTQPGQAAAADKVYGTRSLQADDPATDEVRKRFKLRFTDMEVVAVKRTPYGLFEVQVGTDMIYTDEGVTWVMQGPLIDAATRRDVTRANQERASAMAFSELPLDLALKQVQGKGTRKLAVFEDPNCGYCKQLRQTLKQLDDVTIYTFMYPILSPDSNHKVRDVWCADDPGKSWDDWMLSGQRPSAAQCDAPVDAMVALGRRLMVRGTPTVFFENGTRASGAMSLDQLKARLQAAR